MPVLRLGNREPLSPTAVLTHSANGRSWERRATGSAA